MTTSSLAAWFQGLLGSKTAAAPVVPGTTVVETGDAAVSSVEASVCDALCLAAGTPGAPRTRTSDPNVFGRVPAEMRPGTDANVADTAVGLALTGQRVAGWVTGQHLPSVQERLLMAVGRRVPLLLHARLAAVSRGTTTQATSHDGYHALADTGAFLALAVNAQEAVDLTLVARRVTELSLTPGVVAVDGLETGHAAQNVVMPNADTLRAYLGRPGERVDCPTPAQRLLFGETRSRVPAWFSTDHPAALGGGMSHAQSGAALAGQQVFFAQHVGALVQQACTEFSVLTGRTIAGIRTHRLKDARHVLLAQGSLVELAQAVADAARAQNRNVGVIGVTWLRPFPLKELRDALQHAETVTVLERSSDALSPFPPLTREVRAALAGMRVRVTHAVVGAAGEPVTAAQVLSLCQANVPDRARGGSPVSAARSAYPKREAALQALQKSYPELSEVLPANVPLDVRAGARTVVLCRSGDGVDDTVLTTLAAAFSAAAGPTVHGRWSQTGAGSWLARVTAGKTAVDPGDDVVADLVLVDGVARVQPPPMRHGAAVVFLQHPKQVPAAWRAAITANKARVFAGVSLGGLTTSLLEALLKGEDGGLQAVDAVAAPVAPRVEEDVPAALRQLGAARAGFDSLPRHYGEVVQPSLLGETTVAIPEPWLSVSATPAGGGALGQHATPTWIPAIDPAKCTACGQCWTTCPDSALGALALRTETLFAAAAEKSGVTSPQADKLKRSARQVAQQVDALLTEQNARVLDAAGLAQALERYVSKLGLSGDDAKATDAATHGVMARLATALPLAVTPALFHNDKTPAAPRDVLLLAVDVGSCQGCGGCAAVCGERAIQMVLPEPGMVSREKARWRQWETLPDTRGDTIARASAVTDIGPLAAALLSRHAQGAMGGGRGTEPGSGERIAMRQLVAVVEQQGQRALKARVTLVEDLVNRVDEKLKAVLAAGLPAPDLEALQTALAVQPGKRVALADVLARLERSPNTPQVDAALARRLSTSALELRALLQRSTQGADGLGRARFGVVADSSSVGQWLAGAPGSSVFAPVLVESAHAAPAVAAGMAHGMLEQALGEYRDIRCAELAVDAPPDLELAQQQLHTLTWRDLPVDALDALPPLLLVTRAQGLGPSGMAALAELLGSGLPVKVVLLDRLDVASTAADPTLLALALRSVFVASTSIAHSTHFHGAVSAALAHRGPALVHVHTPSPGADGFKAEATVEYARLAVEARLHPLLRYDPAAHGVFGTRFSLDGNPVAVRPHGDWLKLANRDPSVPQLQAWLAARAGQWTTLQELAGVASPFTDRIRAEERAAAEADLKQRVAALEAEHASRLAELERTQRDRLAAELKANLIKLVAHAPRSGLIRDGGGGAS